MVDVFLPLLRNVITAFTVIANAHSDWLPEVESFTQANKTQLCEVHL